MKVLVPGNLLLAGEYAVTLPGGIGYAVAVDTHVNIVSKPAERFGLTCIFQNQTMQWTQGTPMPHSLGLIEEIMRKTPPLRTPLHITVDSSDFYYSDGRKKGFGSSASTATGLTFLVLYHASGKIPNIARDVFPTALSIHRSFQGGKGSGYDIAASLFGGAGLFTGGLHPSWKPVSVPCAPLFLVRGEKETSTREALKQFQSYRARHLAETKEFVFHSNTCVNAFFSGDIKTALNQGRLLHRHIHDRLGLKGQGLGFQQLLQSFPGKPLGAGEEIAALLVTPEQTPPQGAEPLRLSTEGLRWER